jgi:hypothetical protein
LKKNNQKEQLDRGKKGIKFKKYFGKDKAEI